MRSWSFSIYYIVHTLLKLQNQNHMETEKLVSSARMLCHQPGGIKRRSPGSSVSWRAIGTTWSQKSLKSSLRAASAEKTSTSDVLLIDGFVLFAAESRLLALEYGYMARVRVGGANQTVFRPTTCTGRLS